MSISSGLARQFEDMSAARGRPSHTGPSPLPQPSVAGLYAPTASSVSVATSPMRLAGIPYGPHHLGYAPAEERTILIGGGDGTSTGYGSPAGTYHQQAPTSPFSYNPSAFAAAPSQLGSPSATDPSHRSYKIGSGADLGPGVFPPPPMVASGGRDPRSAEGNYVDDDDRIATDDALRHGQKGGAHIPSTYARRGEAAHAGNGLFGGRAADGGLIGGGRTRSPTGGAGGDPVGRTVSGYARSVSPPLTAIPLSGSLSPPKGGHHRLGDNRFASKYAAAPPLSTPDAPTTASYYRYRSPSHPQQRTGPLYPPAPPQATHHNEGIGGAALVPRAASPPHPYAVASGRSGSVVSGEASSAPLPIRPNFADQNHPYGPTGLVDGSLGMGLGGGGVPGKMAEESGALGMGGVGLLGMRSSSRSPPRALLGGGSRLGLSYEGAGGRPQTSTVATYVRTSTPSLLAPSSTAAGTIPNIGSNIGGGFSYRGSLMGEKGAASGGAYRPSASAAVQHTSMGSATPLTDGLMRRLGERPPLLPSDGGRLGLSRGIGGGGGYSSSSSLGYSYSSPAPLPITASTRPLAAPFRPSVDRDADSERGVYGKMQPYGDHHYGLQQRAPSSRALVPANDLYAADGAALVPYAHRAPSPPKDSFAAAHGTVSLFDAEAIAEPADLVFPASANPSLQTIAPFNGLMIPIPPQLLPSAGAERGEDFVLRSQVAATCSNLERSLAIGAPLRGREGLSLLQQIVMRCRVLRNAHHPHLAAAPLDLSYVPLPPHPLLEEAFHRTVRAGSGAALYSTREDPRVRHLRIDVIADHSEEGRHGTYVEDGVVGKPMLVWSRHGDATSVSGTVPLWDLVEVSTSPDACPVLARYFARPSEDTANRRVGGAGGRGIVGPRMGGSMPAILPAANIIRMLFSSGMELVWIALDEGAADAWTSCLHYITTESQA